MKTKQKLIFTLISMLTVVACNTVKTTVDSSKTEDKSDLIYAKTRWDDVTEQQLKHGKEIAETKCAQCHKQKPIENFTEEHWIKSIDDMAPKAHLSPSEKMALERYILTQKGK